MMSSPFWEAVFPISPFLPSQPCFLQKNYQKSFTDFPIFPYFSKNFHTFHHFSQKTNPISPNLSAGAAGRYQTPMTRIYSPTVRPSFQPDASLPNLSASVPSRCCTGIAGNFPSDVIDHTSLSESPPSRYRDSLAWNLGSDVLDLYLPMSSTYKVSAVLKAVCYIASLRSRNRTGSTWNLGIDVMDLIYLKVAEAVFFSYAENPSFLRSQPINNDFTDKTPQKEPNFSKDFPKTSRLFHTFPYFSKKIPKNPAISKPITAEQKPKH
jgi:hypothetical protein